MKVFIVCIFVSLILNSASVYGQGSLIFDQQSSTNAEQAAGGGIIQHLGPPYGQSFTPGLSSIEFIQLAFFDANAGNGQGATVFVNLRSNAINGPIFGQTAPVTMPDGFGIGGLNAAVTNFYFGSPIALTPGGVYYFQPVVQSGDDWGVSGGEYFYLGGTAFNNGIALTGGDYWFREGIFAVPEPSAAWLIMLGVVCLGLRHVRRLRRMATQVWK